MKVYATPTGVLVNAGAAWLRAREFSFDALFRVDDPHAWLTSRLEPAPDVVVRDVLPPLESQEVWAAGVTYRRSREARMQESKREADIYDRVYEADRPELFFKATRHRTVGHGGTVRIRRDSSWNVPEPELALAVSQSGRVFGYSIGNDMSSRSIEGENPLYLPQAKIYDGSCALGPCLLLTDEPMASTTTIDLRIIRGGAEIYRGSTSLAHIKRQPGELVEYLFRDNSFPNGCYLLTGTGIVPPGDFTLAAGDQVEIGIGPIGTLVNRVAC